MNKGCFCCDDVATCSVRLTLRDCRLDSRFPGHWFTFEALLKTVEFLGQESVIVDLRVISSSFTSQQLGLRDDWVCTHMRVG